MSERINKETPDRSAREALSFAPSAYSGMWSALLRLLRTILFALLSPAAQSYVCVYVLVVMMVVWTPHMSDSVALGLGAILPGILFAQWDWLALGSNAGRWWRRGLRWLAAGLLSALLVGCALALQAELSSAVVSIVWQSPWEAFAGLFSWLIVAAMAALLLGLWAITRWPSRQLLDGHLNAKAWHESVCVIVAGASFVLLFAAVDATELMTRFDGSLDSGTFLLAVFASALYAVVRLYAQPALAAVINGWRRGSRRLQASQRLCVIDLHDSITARSTRGLTLHLLKFARTWSASGTTILMRDPSLAAATTGWHTRWAARAQLVDRLFVRKNEDARRWTGTWLGWTGRHQPPLLECYVPPEHRSALLDALAKRDESMLFLVIPAAEPHSAEQNGAGTSTESRFTLDSLTHLPVLPRRRSFLLADSEPTVAPTKTHWWLRGSINTGSGRSSIVAALRDKATASLRERRIVILARAVLEFAALEIVLLLDERIDDDGRVINATAYRRGQLIAQVDTVIVLLDTAWLERKRSALVEAEVFKPLIDTSPQVIMVYEEIENVGLRILSRREFAMRLPGLRDGAQSATWISTHFDAPTRWTKLAETILGVSPDIPASDADKEAVILQRELDAAATKWQESGRLSDLLRGSQLKEAMRRLRGHPHSIKSAQHAFIHVSAEHQARRRIAVYSISVLLSIGILAYLAIGNAYEHQQWRAGAESVYTTDQLPLYFIEVDDEGVFWDRRQADGAFRGIQSSVAARDTLVVTFVHGWHHSASCCDEKVLGFHTLLQKLQQMSPRTQVVGLYVGWRGRSLPRMLDYFTFWGRKNVAERIGQGDLRVFLTRLQGLFADLRGQERGTNQQNSIGWILVGDGLGAQVVLRAVMDKLEDRVQSVSDAPTYQRDEAQATPRDPDLSHLISGIGDLIVLLNPAVESAQYQRLHLLSKGLKYSSLQTPVMLAFSAENDPVRGRLFTLGRVLGEIFTATLPSRAASQRTLSRQALGFYPDQVTHRLLPTDANMKLVAAPIQGNASCANRSCESSILQWQDAPANRQPNSLSPNAPALSRFDFSGDVTFNNIRLSPEAASVPYRPLIVARTGPAIIDGHNGTLSQPFLDFLVPYIVYTQEKVHINGTLQDLMFEREKAQRLKR